LDNPRSIQVGEYEEIPITSGEPGASARETEGPYLTRHELEAVEQRLLFETGANPSKYFSYGYGTVKPKGWTGTVLTSDVRLEVWPKGARGAALGYQDLSALQNNIGEMLQFYLGADVWDLGMADLSTASTFYERTLEVFCTSVRAARRRRVLRRYVAQEAVRPSCRGRVVFERQVVLQARRPGMFHVRWVELSEDTPENRILKAALEDALFRVGPGMTRKVEELLVEFRGVGAARDIAAEFALVEKRRAAEEYRDALDMARALLRGEGTALFGGDLSGRAQCVFLPMVFQAFTYRLARMAAAERGLESRGEHVHRLGIWDVCGEDPPQRDNPSDDDPLAIRPDIEILDAGGDKTLAVLDAKWKLLRPDKDNLGLSSDLVQQMVTYCVRLGCSSATLLFPWIGRDAREPLGKDGYRRLRIPESEPPIRIDVACVPLLWSHVSEAADQVNAIVGRALEP